MRIVIRVPLLYSSRWVVITRSGGFVLLALFLLATWWTAQFYSAFGNRVVRYALAFITVQVLLLLLLALGLMIAKMVSIHRQKVRAVWERRIEQLLTDALLFQKNREGLLAECLKHPDQAEA